MRERIQRGDKKMRQSERPSIGLIGVTTDPTNNGSAGRQIRAMIGLDDEEKRRRLHTPDERRERPRELTDIFCS